MHMQAIHQIYNSPNFKIGDVKSTISYSRYLIIKAQLAGNFIFDGHTPSKEETDIALKCHQHCDIIGYELSTCKEEKIPDLLECYDMLYRLGYKKAPNTELIDRAKTRFFNSWKAGNNNITESSLFGILAAMVKSKKADSDQTKAYLSILDRWITTLKKHNHFPDVTSYENYQRLALFMHENIDRYTDCDSDDMKHRIYAYNRVDDLSPIGTAILRAYRHFINSLSLTILDFDDKLKLDNRILRELLTRRDQNHYDREASRLALTYNRVLD